MKPERLLLPVDITRCPLDILELVNTFARRPEVSVILLYVMPPSNRRFWFIPRAEPPTRDTALRLLRRLADEHLGPLPQVIPRVRSGNVADQILAEANAMAVNLIILPTHNQSVPQRVRSFFSDSGAIMSALAEHLIREAQCGVFLVHTRRRFNCQRAWGGGCENKVDHSPGKVLAWESPRVAALGNRCLGPGV